MKIKVGDICKLHSNFNGEEYTRKVLVFKKDEARSKKYKDIFICFTLTNVRNMHPQVIGKHEYFWTNADKLSQIK